MAGVLEVADSRYREGVRLNRTTMRAASSLWRRMDARDLDASWLRLAPLLLALVSRAQEMAAAGADDYVDAALQAQGREDTAAGSIVAAALSGVASDGRELDTLLYSPVTTAKTLLGQGASAARALQGGGFAMKMIVGTQVADAGRVADGIAIAARPTVSGYVRMLSPPSCPRCAILAGRFYRWSSGFARHPRCDCRHIPAAENVAGDLTTDPMKAYRAGQIEGLSDAEKAALEEGADISQVVNARRGTYTAGGRRYTREGTTRRGFAGHRLGQFQKVEGERYRRSRIARLTPDQIFADATSRDDAIRLLRRFGYII